MSLRLAEEKDLDEVLRMAKRFHEVSPYSDCEFSYESCRNIFDQYLNDDRTNLVIILAEDVSPYGMIIGIKSNPPFSEEPVCTELAWWVDEYKRGRESMDLLWAYQEWAKRVKSKLTVVAMLNDLTDLTKLYKRAGYEQAETSFVRRTNGSI